MGLSFEERIEKTMFTVDGMVKEASNLPDGHPLRDKCDQLWRALLGQTSNSTHWLLGSATDSEIRRDTIDPWSVAIRCKIFEAHQEPEEQEEVDEAFDPFHYFLNIAGLLRQCSTLEATVYEIYRASEVLVYAVRRYSDELRRGLLAFDNLISDIQGFCFSHFVESDNFARAYLIHRIAKLCYGPNSSQPDVITVWLIDDCIHHNIGQSMRSGLITLRQLSNYHLGLVQALTLDPVAAKSRLLTVLRLAGSSFCYDHQYKKLLQLLTAVGWSDEDIATVEAECASCKASYQAAVDLDNQRIKTQALHREVEVYGSQKFTAPRMCDDRSPAE